jgi:GTP cyclohydrolase I
VDLSPEAIVREQEIATAVSTILQNLGYDLTDQHFRRTPERVAKMLSEFRANGDPESVKSLLEVVFTENTIDSVVVEGPITFNSMCAHHMLPVTGTAYVGYLPDKHVCGLSKLARVTYHYASQLTVQERVTQQIADALVEHLKPMGAMVVIKATHGCMSIRGVRERDCETATSVVRGIFKDSAAARNEFLQLVAMGGAK